MAETNENINTEQPSQDGVDIAISQYLNDSQDGKPTSDAQQSQDSTQKPDEQQPSYEITEDQAEQLKELGYDVEKDLDEFEPEDIKNILETKTAKPSAIEIQEEPEVIITEGIAKKYGGIAKMMIGKPFSELTKAFAEKEKTIQKLTSELKQNQSVLTKNEISKIDELDNKINTFPYEKEEELKADIQKLVEMKVQAELRKSAVDPEQEDAIKQSFEAIQSQIPEGMDAQATYQEWAKTLTPQQVEAYSKVPDAIIIDAVKSFATLKSKNAVVQETDTKLQESEKDKEKQIRIAAAKKAAEAIKSSNNKSVKGSKFSIVPRANSGNKDFSNVDWTIKEFMENQ